MTKLNFNSYIYNKIKKICFEFINLVLKKTVFYNEYHELKITKYFLSRFDNSDQYCIDIGASPPPHFYKIFLKYKFKIFCVDPIQLSNFNNIKKLNKRFKYFKGVISHTNRPIRFFFGLKEFEAISSRFSPVINRSFKKNNFSAKNVNSLTYNKFIKKFKIKNIFFLKIDTEGSEFYIIKNIKKNAPQIIMVEYQKENLKSYIKLKKAIKILFKEKLFEDSLFVDRTNPSKQLIRYNDHLRIISSNNITGNFFIFKKNILRKQDLIILNKEFRKSKNKKRIFV
jgi:FkbM family methyltransferase